MSHVEQLVAAVKTTAECRFIAAARLEQRDLRGTQLTAFTSAYVIILTTLPYFLDLPATLADQVNLLTVALAIIVLVSSLSQYSRGDVAKAEQHHRCGLELKELHRAMLAEMSGMTQRAFRTFSAKYSLILQKYSVNHDPIDYMIYELQRSDDMPWVGYRKKAYNTIHVTLVTGFPHITLILSTVLLGYIIFGHAIPAHIAP